MGGRGRGSLGNQNRHVRQAPGSFVYMNNHLYNKNTEYEFDDMLMTEGDTMTYGYNQFVHDMLLRETGVDIPVEDLMEYSKALDRWSSTWYSSIRNAQIKNLNNAERKVADTLEEFIQRSPKWNGGVLYRGIRVNESTLELLKNAKDDGSIIDMRGLSSWSTSKEIATSFAKSVDYGVIFVTNSPKLKHGTSIVHYSTIRVEEEVLVSSKARFRIVDIKRHENIENIYYFYVDEI